MRLVDLLLTQRSQPTVVDNRLSANSYAKKPSMPSRPTLTVDQQWPSCFQLQNIVARTTNRAPPTRSSARTTAAVAEDRVRDRRPTLTPFPAWPAACKETNVDWRQTSATGEETSPALVARLLRRGRIDMYGSAVPFDDATNVEQQAPAIGGDSREVDAMFRCGRVWSDEEMLTCLSTPADCLAFSRTATSADQPVETSNDWINGFTTDFDVPTCFDAGTTRKNSVAGSSCGRQRCLSMLSTSSSDSDAVAFSSPGVRVDQRRAAARNVAASDGYHSLETSPGTPASCSSSSAGTLWTVGGPDQLPPSAADPMTVDWSDCWAASTANAEIESGACAEASYFYGATDAVADDVAVVADEAFDGQFGVDAFELFSFDDVCKDEIDDDGLHFTLS